jgi:selenocysteine lyase/cysteine desulfurase
LLKDKIGLRYPERVTAFTRRTNPLVQFLSGVKIPRHKRPVVFISHMEHHSNHTSWLETIAKVEIIECNKNGLVDIGAFEKAINKYSKNRLKIAALTACSNVTGIETPYHEIAEIIHKANGYCVVDFACSAPYVKIDMHPVNPLQQLDAICFSPHKFLGGPGTTGVLIFNKKLYLNNIPDNPGGGTVIYTNPWNLHAYIDNIEDREDGGTPPFIQGIKTALAISLKEKMGIEKIKERENELCQMVYKFANENDWFNILSAKNQNRMPVFSFFIDGIHYNLLVRILNDRYGIQMRGGCACAGTYGHILLNLNQTESMQIYNKIIGNDNSCRPGWVRMSLHPTTSNNELFFIFKALKEIYNTIDESRKEYFYDNEKNAYFHVSKKCQDIENKQVDAWYGTDLL